MEDLEQKIATLDETPSSGSHPSRLFVEVTTRCNLKCGMCVKQNNGGGIVEGSMSADTFNALVPAFPHIEALILNGIGESLLHPDLEKFIEKARSLMPKGSWVGFQTNGMLLNGPLALSLVEAGLDRICLSIDSASAESFSLIRRGGDIGGMESAFSALSKARAGGRDLQIGIEFVLMKDNVRELPSVLRWAGRRGATFALVTQLLPYHQGLSSQTAYDTNTQGAISVYERWRASGLKEGVDISRYFDIFMKFSKTPEEEKVIDFIERMKKEADDRGITLHMERLLRRDEEWFAGVENIFEEARRTAREEGINLTLPETAPSNTRKCEFVETGGAFVSWDGDVHPCYFLWHRFRCYVGGLEKYVKPWVFGNLRDTDIIDIWNSRQYRQFRDTVSLYRFPFCFDCGFALCDYVQTEDFEQDCYIQSVPCGSCLWCTGLFRCLQ